MLNYAEQPTDLVLFRLPAGRQQALTRSVPAERLRVRTLSEFADLRHTLTVADDAVAIVELAQLQADERRELAGMVTSAQSPPWLVALSVATLQDPTLGDWLDARVDWFIGPDEPAGLIVRHLIRWQDSRAMARENALFRAAIRIAPCGIVFTDARVPDDPTVFVNDTFEAITGYPRAELLGQNCRILQTGLLAQAGAEEIRKARAAGQPAHVKLYNRRKDGAHFVNELHLTPFRDHRGRLTHYIGAMQDATVRESALQRLEAVPLKLWQVDALLRTEFINPAWNDVFPDPGVLPPPDVLTAVHPEEIEAVHEALQRALRSGRQVGVEARLKLHDGALGWHHFRLAPRLADDGQVIGLFAAVVDIAANRATEERSSRRLQQLSLQSLLMRRLLGGAVIDASAAGQALEIVAEMLGAEEMAVVSLDAGADSIMQLRWQWSVDEASALPALLPGRRLKEVFPFSAVRLLYAETAVLVDRAESKRLAGQSAVLAFALRREGQVVGCLFATCAAPPEDWERESAEQLKSIGGLLHFAC